VWLILLLGVAIPFIVWLYMAGFVFYVHHTDENTRWYDDSTEWRAAQPDLADTHGTKLTLRLDLLLHHALEHTAHHVNPAIPSYRIAAAQRALERMFPGEVPMQPITLRRYFEITRRCQLYDARRHRWVRFADLKAKVPAVSNGALTRGVEP
jgi:omega-6 fatty acid desaturase (delta-12 desaturase)